MYDVYPYYAAAASRGRNGGTFPQKKIEAQLKKGGTGHPTDLIVNNGF